MSAARITGGCQCGAVRYALNGPLFDAGLCHCRMCQKAFGSLFAPLVGVALEHLEFTRGKPSIFKSSDLVDRGFCKRCGTPLTFCYVGRGDIYLSIGSLDRPADAQPEKQYGVESRLRWFPKLAALPEETTASNTPADRLKTIRATNHQHPDHDTPQWPARG